MKPYLIRNTLPYRIERRSRRRRLLGWLFALACWAPIIAFWLMFANEDLRLW